MAEVHRERRSGNVEQVFSALLNYFIGLGSLSRSIPPASLRLCGIIKIGYKTRKQHIEDASS